MNLLSVIKSKTKPDHNPKPNPKPKAPISLSRFLPRIATVWIRTYSKLIHPSPYYTFTVRDAAHHFRPKDSSSKRCTDCTLGVGKR